MARQGEMGFTKKRLICAGLALLAACAATKPGITGVRQAEGDSGYYLRRDHIPLCDLHLEDVREGGETYARIREVDLRFDSSDGLMAWLREEGRPSPGAKISVRIDDPINSPIASPQAFIDYCVEQNVDLYWSRRGAFRVDPSKEARWLVRSLSLTNPLRDTTIVATRGKAGRFISPWKMELDRYGVATLTVGRADNPHAILEFEVSEQDLVELARVIESLGDLETLTLTQPTLLYLDCTPTQRLEITRNGKRTAWLIDSPSEEETGKGVAWIFEWMKYLADHQGAKFIYPREVVPLSHTPGE